MPRLVSDVSGHTRAGAQLQTTTRVARNANATALTCSVTFFEHRSDGVPCRRLGALPREIVKRSIAPPALRQNLELCRRERIAALVWRSDRVRF